MAGNSAIEWTEHTWNPVVGCSILSPGCIHCYAMPMAARIEAMNAGVRDGGKGTASPQYDGTTKKVNGNAVWTGKLALAPESILLQPLKRKKPTTYFVNSMGDLFHEDCPDEWIDKVFAVMALSPQHTFQVLTKRAGRMRDYVDGITRQEWWKARLFADDKRPYPFPNWPLSNVWLGVSTERQQEADERIPLLLQTPAAIRFISAEPLLGPIDLRQWSHSYGCGCGWGGDSPLDYCNNCGWKGDAPIVDTAHGDHVGDCPQCREPLSDYNACPECDGHDGDGMSFGPNYLPKLDWVIVGGESGRDARAMHPAWARSLRDQCSAAGVRFFFKQWGEWAPSTPEAAAGNIRSGWRCLAAHPHVAKAAELYPEAGAAFVEHMGKKHAGRLLDGIEHNAMPEIAR